MKGPPRLADAQSDPLVVSMLTAARRERPDARGAERALSALGVSATALAASKPALGIAAGHVGALAYGKWLAVGFATGVAVLGSGQAAYRAAAGPAVNDAEAVAVSSGAMRKPATPNGPHTATNPEPPDVRQKPTIASGGEPRSPVLPAKKSAHSTYASEQVTKAAPQRAVAAPDTPSSLDGVPQLGVSTPARGSAVAASTQSALARELALIDEARRALSSGRPMDAVQTLDRYEQEWPSGHLRRDAAYLRMESHAASGNRVAAVRAAAALLELYPRGAYAERARAVLGDQK